MKNMIIGSYVAEFYIDSKTLDWATEEGCPSIFHDYVADILITALGITGSANVFCKCKYGGYNLSWVLENGTEIATTFSEEELLNVLKNKTIDYTFNIRETTSQKPNLLKG